jgi:ferrochelatase
VLAPHRSSLGSEEYLARAERAAGGAGLALTPVHQWYDEPGFAGLLAPRLRAALATLPGIRVAVLFTAHSLPVRAMGDYADQLAASAAAVAGAAGLAGDWRVAWQSAGRTPEPWIGPDVLEVVRGLPAEGYGGVVVCPVGFVADHLEVLYDLDVEARRVAGEAGVAFARTASLDHDPALLALLARVVRRAAGEEPGGA